MSTGQLTQTPTVFERFHTLGREYVEIKSRSMARRVRNTLTEPEDFEQEVWRKLDLWIRGHPLEASGLLESESLDRAATRFLNVYAHARMCDYIDGVLRNDKPLDPETAPFGGYDILDGGFVGACDRFSYKHTGATSVEELVEFVKSKCFDDVERRMFDFLLHPPVELVRLLMKRISRTVKCAATLEEGRLRLHGDDAQRVTPLRISWDCPLPEKEGHIETSVGLCNVRQTRNTITLVFSVAHIVVKIPKASMVGGYVRTVIRTSSNYCIFSGDRSMILTASLLGIRPKDARNMWFHLKYILDVYLGFNAEAVSEASGEQ